MLRRLASLLLVTAVGVTALAVAAPAAQASAEESQFVQLANSARSNNGLRSYSVATDLVSVARRHAQRMAASKSIYHNGNLGSEVSNWQAVGENVGMGGSASSIHQAFMNSAPHRANILDRDFTQVGMGVAYDSDGVMYVTQVFRKPSGSTYTAPAPAPKPRTTATTAPRTTTYKPVAAPVATPVAKPVAKPVVKRPAAPRNALADRLARARALAAAHAAEGALDHAVTYVSVMGSLA